MGDKPESGSVDVLGMACPQMAVVCGEPVQCPQDLYIPPHALKIFLDAFEGPLDLLLYLIRKQNLDILDIPIAEITRQYMQYIELMRGVMKLELAAEYLLMAAILGEIKSRMLLPKPPVEDNNQEDPRAELVRHLREYERFKKAAMNIASLPRIDRDIQVAHVDPGDHNVIKVLPPLELNEMLLTLKNLLHRIELCEHHTIASEALSVRQRMSDLLGFLKQGHYSRFDTLLSASEGRHGVVVSFLATLELAKEKIIDLIQETPFSPIYLQVTINATLDTFDGTSGNSLSTISNSTPSTTF